MSRAPYPPAVRGLFMGLIAACIVGGVVLTAVGIYTVVKGPDCADISPEECVLLTDVSAAFARRQLIFGGALCAFGVAVYALSRERISSTGVKTT